MIKLPRLTLFGVRQREAHTTLTARGKILWTSGNFLMLVGIVLLVYVGGLYATDEYGLYAARGDSDVPAIGNIVEPVRSEADVAAAPLPFILPVLNVGSTGGATADDQVMGAVPTGAQAQHQGTVSRVVIPSIGVDSKVIEVGWEVQQQNGKPVAIWDVAKYAVGQNQGSANPGEGGNIVLAGHVGGYGKVFKDLFYVKPGDQITLYSKGEQYLYIVKDHFLVTEDGVSAAQHAANVQLIGATNQETVTMLTCWPTRSPDRFIQRVIIRAVPISASVSAMQQTQNRWGIR